MILKVSLVVALVASASAGGTSSGGVSINSRSEDNHGNYKFEYDINDAHGATQNRWETSGDYNSKKGGYSLSEPDGRFRQVQYEADGNGFRVLVRTNEPGTKTHFPAHAAIINEAPPVQVKVATAGLAAAHAQPVPATLPLSGKKVVAAAGPAPVLHGPALHHVAAGAPVGVHHASVVKPVVPVASAEVHSAAAVSGAELPLHQVIPAVYGARVQKQVVPLAHQGTHSTPVLKQTVPVSHQVMYPAPVLKQGIPVVPQVVHAAPVLKPAVPVAHQVVQAASVWKQPVAVAHQVVHPAPVLKQAIPVAGHVLHAAPVLKPAVPVAHQIVQAASVWKQPVAVAHQAVRAASVWRQPVEVAHQVVHPVPLFKQAVPMAHQVVYAAPLLKPAVPVAHQIVQAASVWRQPVAVAHQVVHPAPVLKQAVPVAHVVHTAPVLKPAVPLAHQVVQAVSVWKQPVAVPHQVVRPAPVLKQTVPVAQQVAYAAPVLKQALPVTHQIVQAPVWKQPVGVAHQVVHPAPLLKQALPVAHHLVHITPVLKPAVPVAHQVVQAASVWKLPIGGAHQVVHPAAVLKQAVPVAHQTVHPAPILKQTVPLAHQVVSAAPVLKQAVPVTHQVVQAVPVWKQSLPVAHEVVHPAPVLKQAVPLPHQVVHTAPLLKQAMSATYRVQGVPLLKQAVAIPHTVGFAPGIRPAVVNNAPHFRPAVPVAQHAIVNSAVPVGTPLFLAPAFKPAVVHTPQVWKPVVPVSRTVAYAPPANPVAPLLSHVVHGAPVSGTSAKLTLPLAPYAHGMPAAEVVAQGRPLYMLSVPVAKFSAQAPLFLHQTPVAKLPAVPVAPAVISRVPDQRYLAASATPLAVSKVQVTKVVPPVAASQPAFFQPVTVQKLAFPSVSHLPVHVQPRVVPSVQFAGPQTFKMVQVTKAALGQLYGSGVVLRGPPLYKGASHRALGLPLTVFGPSMLSVPGPLAPLEPLPKLALVNNVASVKQEVKVAPVLSSGFKPILPAAPAHGPYGHVPAIDSPHVGYGGATQGKSYQQPYQLDLLRTSGYGHGVAYDVRQVSPGHICPGFHVQHQIGQIELRPQHEHVGSKVQFDDAVVAQQVLPLAKLGPSPRPSVAYSPGTIKKSPPSLGIPQEKVANAGVVYSKTQKRYGERPSSYGGPSQLVAEEDNAGVPISDVDVADVVDSLRYGSSRGRDRLGRTRSSSYSRGTTSEIPSPSAFRGQVAEDDILLATDAKISPLAGPYHRKRHGGY